MANINYETEKAKLDAFKPGDASMFWKPTAGQYKVKALNELEDADPYKEEGKEDQPQAVLHLKILQKDNVDIEKDAETNWTMAKGKSLASAYGQLVKLASSRNNVLKDTEFLIVVTNDGNKNSYTIVMTA